MTGRLGIQAAAHAGAAPGGRPARPRPLLAPALAFIAGISVSELGGCMPGWAHTLIWRATLAALALPLVLAVRQRERPAAMRAVLLLAALGLGLSRHQAVVRLPSHHVAHLATDEGVVTRIAGQIVTEPTTVPAEKRNPYLPFAPPAHVRFVLAAEELRATNRPGPITGYVRVSVEAERLAVRLGERVVVTGRLYRPRGARNPGETDWASLYRLQSIYAGLAAEGPEYVERCAGGRVGTLALVARLRAWTRGLLFSPHADLDADRTMRLLDAMVLGQRSAADRALNEVFLRTGAIHFLSVSGFHVGVLAGAAWLLVRRLLRGGRRAAAVVTLLAIVSYAVIAEPNAPILRAAIMGGLLCLAQLAGRPFCGLNWLALSALCILMCNPLELFRAGFQLSFAQVLALLTLVPGIYRALVQRAADGDVPRDADSLAELVARRLWRWLVGLTVVCACAWAVSLPLVLFHFGRFAPLGALQSVVVSPLVAMTIVLAFVALLLGWVPAVGPLLAVVLRATTDLLLRAVELLAQLPGTLIETQRPPAAFVLLVYAGLLWLLWTRRHGARPAAAPHAGATGPGPAAVTAGVRHPRRWPGTPVGIGLVGLGVACWVLPDLSRPADPALHVLAVGSGACALLTTAQGALLLDVGTSHNADAGETAVQAARALGADRLAALVLSHANFDHYSGAATVLNRLPTGRLVVNPYFAQAAAESPAVRQLLDTVPDALLPAAVWRAGDRFELGGVAIDVLWPPAGLDESWRPNDRSLVLRVAAAGRRIIIPGDIEGRALRSLVAAHEGGAIDLSADVLIAPHHGAVVPGATQAFYRAVAPRVVISSTGRDRPELRTLIRAAVGADVRLLSTDAVGAVTVRMAPPGALAVETPFAPPVGTAR